MAAQGRFFLRCLLKRHSILSKQLCQREASISPCRMIHLSAVSESLYSKIYMDPTFRKEDLEEGLDDEDPRHFHPIKAAFNDQTSSVRYDPLVAKFIRIITREGNKLRARRIVEKTFETIKLTQLEKWHTASPDDRDLIELNPTTIFHQAVENCRPLVITQTVRRGGVVYKVPIPVFPSRQIHMAICWLVEVAEEKDAWIRIWVPLAHEIINAANSEGKALRKKQEIHKFCEANRAYAHFRW